MVCPNCGFAQPDGTPECHRCGVVFSKWESSRTHPPSDPGSACGRVLESVADGQLGPREAKMLVGGALAALILYAIPFTRFVLSALVTLFHELGHAVAAWLLGHPAVPAFDFVYGGGFTYWQDFRLPLALLLAAALLWLAWVFRRNTGVLGAIALLLGLWLLAISAAWRRELVISAAGHVAEVVLAGVFFFMALANVGWRRPEVERPLGTFLAFFVQLNVLHFAWKLGHDQAFRDWYLAGKGGAVMNDLETIALDLRIYVGVNLSVEDLAAWLVLLSLLSLPMALLVYRFRRRVFRLTSLLLNPGCS